MVVDFFDSSCKEEPPRKDIVFGLCDDEDGTAAYSTTDTDKKWVGVVNNKTEKVIEFTAIDNCIIINKEKSEEKESTCDGMLTFDGGIYLVELKSRGVGGWIPKAISQLNNTIKLLKEHNNLDDFKIRKAYACNKRNPSFTTINHESKMKFFKETNGF